MTCSDEKTGVQALSTIKTSAMKPGVTKRIDPEYTRNGTTCLIAARDVGTGKIIEYTQGQTRNEKDFLDHTKNIVQINPDIEHIIICDQLNTHKSASLVKWIAIEHGINPESLGIKGKEGILKSLKTRMLFLEDKTHRIRFLYTPKHCSWMNQIENWFGVLQRKVINHGQFLSVDQLENNIAAFITYYNQFLARPVDWKFKGEKYRAKIKN